MLLFLVLLSTFTHGNSLAFTTPTPTPPPRRAISADAPYPTFFNLIPQENDRAVLLFDGTTAESFPSNICGFGDSQGDQLNDDECFDGCYNNVGSVIANNVQCKSFETCTVSNGVLCCAYQGKCTNIFTSCTNINRLNPTPTTTQVGVLTCGYNGEDYSNAPPTTLSQYTYNWNDWTIDPNNGNGPFAGLTLFETAYATGICNVLALPQGQVGHVCADLGEEASGNVINLVAPIDVQKQNAETVLLYEPTTGYYTLSQTCDLTQCAPTYCYFSYYHTGTPTAISFPQPTDPVDWLALNSAINAPVCVDAMTSICPPLYDSLQTIARDIWDMTPSTSTCSNLSRTSCPGLCKDDAVTYLDWVINTCENNPPYDDSTTLTSEWLDYDSISAAVYDSLFPWSWRLEADNTTLTNDASHSSNPTSCPSVRSKLLSFAIINGVVFVCSVFLGRRDVVYYIFRGKFGKKGSRSWPWTGLISVALNLGANVINARLSLSVGGFHKVPLGGLFLLWSSRPRLAWTAAMLMSVNKEESIYFAFGVSAMFAEIVLQAVGAVYLGITVHFAAKNHYYLRHHLDDAPHVQDALIMYSGALLWMVFIGVAIIYAFFLFTPVGTIAKAGITSAIRIIAPYLGGTKKIPDRPSTSSRSVLGAEEEGGLPGLSQQNSGDEVWHLSQCAAAATKQPFASSRLRDSRSYLEADSSLHRMGFSSSLPALVKVLIVLLALPWIGQWLFWAGFLRLAADTYCPPRLWTNTSIWCLFSILGVFSGATF